MKNNLIKVAAAMQPGHELCYGGEGDVTYENAQARMRTFLLMDAANMKNALVVGTCDLSELALGWCTYNGDHMSMYAVNASVPKTMVRFVCKAYAENCQREELRQAPRGDWRMASDASVSLWME